MQQFFLIIHVLAAVGLIALVLLQQGRGADAGAAFGSGSSGTLFGARGPASFLTRITAILAAVFFLTSLALAYMVSHSQDRASVIEKLRDDNARVIPEEDISIPPDPAASQPDMSRESNPDIPIAPTTDGPAAGLSEDDSSKTPSKPKDSKDAKE
uniref:Protein-export membrane protein SecG n=1 Tax=Candidatus Kentrum sp. FM TaxID=2126340 RepID=A0A450T4U7_9GAMM|nr:MAG: preprotein translocase subunit SecG [Candidatus Kentron sp. FM]VFJ61620.1 MAG: preprotein translocase subunit SecG [Candidatus Kentron sp. FM]VFK14955.1 MAG: preprotein translocase subunit SecG [Candidatus Kentron sp. FM]